jgi:hypothetical protein
MARERGPGTLGGTIDEIKSGTFLESSRTRSSRRKSGWNLLLPIVIFPLWIGIWWMAIELGCVAHLLLAGRSVPPISDWMKVLGSGMSFAHFLILFSPLIPTMTAAAVIGNYLVYLVPPARRAMDAEDRAFPGTEYPTAQRELKRLTLYTAPIALALLLLGAWVLR